MGYNGIEAAKMGLGIPQPTAYLNLSIAVRSATFIEGAIFHWDYHYFLNLYDS
jgi:hypothetical protein